MGDRKRVNEIVGGTITWNQWINKNYGNKLTISGITYTNNNNGTWTADGTSTGVSLYEVRENLSTSIICKGHKVLIYAIEPAYNSATFVRVTQENGTNLYLQPFTSNINATILDATNGIRTVILQIANNTTVSNLIFSINVFDLTLMFGSTIADYLYNLEKTTAGAGVAWFKKLFPKDYYEYNEGELMSVNTSAHEMVGFNQWDEEWEVGYISVGNGQNASGNGNIRSKNHISVLPDTTYYYRNSYPTGRYTAILWYGADKNYLGTYQQLVQNNTFTTPNNCYYLRFYIFEDYGTTYNNDICINLSGPRNGEYEPYKKNTYTLDSGLTLRGIPKLDANNKLYYDGDLYSADGVVTRRYGIVDLGTLNWYLYSLSSSYGNLFYCDALISYISLKNAQNDITAAKCDKYITIPNVYNGIIGSDYEQPNKTLRVRSNDGRLYIRDESYTDAATFKAALSGVMLVCELAIPTTETALPYAPI